MLLLAGRVACRTLCHMQGVSVTGRSPLSLFPFSKPITCIYTIIVNGCQWWGNLLTAQPQDIKLFYHDPFLFSHLILSRLSLFLHREVSQIEIGYRSKLSYTHLSFKHLYGSLIALYTVFQILAGCVMHTLSRAYPSMTRGNYSPK